MRLPTLLFVSFLVCHCRKIRHSRHRVEEQLLADGETDNVSPQFTITINEINIDSGGTVPKHYVELLAQRNPAAPHAPNEPPLKGWRLLMIRGATMDVVMSLDLANYRLTGPYLVIGDYNVPNVGVSFADPKTEIAFSSMAFPNMDESPYGLILLGAMDIISSEALSLPSKSGSFQPLNIASDDYRKKLITELAWDLVVVGRRVTTNQCDFFSALFPARSFSRDLTYILRDRDAPTSSVNDYSLNYCCEDPVPYSPGCFKLGPPTPGEDNDCRGKQFILEFEINNVEASRQPGFFVDQNQGFCKANFPGVQPYRYSLVHDHDYAAAVARVMQSPDCVRPPHVMEIDHNEASLQRTAMTVPVQQQPKKYFTSFNEENFKLCEDHFSNPEELLQGFYKAWLDVKPEQDKCLITCRVCRKYFESGWRPDQKHKQNIQQNGLLSKSPKAKYNNQKTVRDHLTDPVHTEAMFFFAQLESASTRSAQISIEAAQELEEKKRLRPTMNEFSLGYTELRAGVSFECHGLFMNNAECIGVDIGFKHRNGRSLALISVTTSAGFHKRLLQQLVNEQKYFSLICDGTTNRNIPYLVCLIQTLEDSKPIVYFWGLLVITTGETGFNMVEDLKIRILEDDSIVPGFEHYFRSHVIASVSDSASNMAGVRNSFYTHLNHYAITDVALVKCGAHKLQRAILHAINFPTDEPSPTVAEKDRKRYFKSFAKINNKFYSFYMSRGSKKFQEFIELAEEHEIPAYRINYFFDVRWACSHKRCMETMYKNYDALRLDLGRIVNDEQFDKDAKAKANELYRNLLDKTFPVVVAEFVDFLTVFGIMSQRFQSKGGIMIGNVGIIRDGYADLERLKNTPGAYLQGFLNQCFCPDLCLEGECSLSDYDTCTEVHKPLKDSTKRVDKLRIREDGQHTIKLSDFRNTLYEKLQDQIVEYFSPEQLEAFEVFNPKNFKLQCTSGTTVAAVCSNLMNCYESLPTIVPNTESKSPEENIRIVCGFYGIRDVVTIIHDWELVMSAILTDDVSKASHNDDPAKYWPSQMQRSDLPFTAAIRGLLERILVTSFTSADAERAFSYVSHIKTPDRQNMDPRTLENLVRIAFNGPDVLSEQSLFEYTKEFVKTSSRVDDASMVGGRPPNPDAYKSFFSKSKIF